MSDATPERDDTRRDMKVLGKIDLRTWLLILAILGGGGGGTAAAISKFLPSGAESDELQAARAKLEAVDADWRKRVETNLEDQGKRLTSLQTTVTRIAEKLHVREDR